MLRARRFSRAVLIAASLVAGACGEPPEKEINQAQGAIDTARAAGADQYAHEEFIAAQEALKRARDAVNQRDYRLALNHALDSRERAQNAAKEVGDRKASARADADRALLNVSAALGEARAKLKAAENAHVAPKALPEARRTIADGERSLQEARAAFKRGDYLAVPDIVTSTTARLHATARELDGAVSTASHRRR